MAIRTPLSKIAPQGDAYRIGLSSGLITILNAGDPAFSLQWTSTTYKMIIQEIDINFVLTTAFGAAQDISWGAYFARSYTVADTGGTAATLTGNNCKLDTNFNTTRVADMRIATTVALTAGTRTLDTQPLIMRCGMLGNALGNHMGELIRSIGVRDAENPITIRTNEGLVIAPIVTMGATGVGHLYVRMSWVEVPNATT